MRTETAARTLYTFKELPWNIQDKVLQNLADINVNYEWWNGVYDDAKSIGIKITGFDIDRGSYCNGEFLLAANEVAANIFRDHGENCETYKTATDFMAEWEPVFANYMDESSPDYESYESENKLQEIESEFLRSLLEDYRIILQHEYEYLASEPAIIETIEINQYEFDENGNLA